MCDHSKGANSEQGQVSLLSRPEKRFSTGVFFRVSMHVRVNLFTFCMSVNKCLCMSACVCMYILGGGGGGRSFRHLGA